MEALTITVNGTQVDVPVSEVTPSTSLAEFIRNRLHLTGTKIACGQAGCGACVVAVKETKKKGDAAKTKSVNSCLVPLLSCDGWSVTTVEGLGSQKSGLAPVQDRLNAFHGTQCGFCTPGMIMQMHSLREAAGEDALTVADVENAFDGNLCRCTGYRPILDAFKSFAADAPDSLKQKIRSSTDIEDLNKTCLSRVCGSGVCAGKCAKGGSSWSTAAETKWLRPNSLQHLLDEIKAIPKGKTYRIVAGNTGPGIYDDGQFDVYVDVRDVTELSAVARSAQQLVLGAATTLTEAIAALEAHANNHQEFAYAREIAKHLKKVANTSVRNRATIGGNLMLKHAHNDFPSDVFILLEAAGADVVVKAADGTETVANPVEWLKKSMDKKILLKFVLPPRGSDYIFRSYKISPRLQNAHAYVNAAFLARINPADLSVLEKPRLAFGGVSSSFVRASATEDLAVGKRINDASALANVLKKLKAEAVPDQDPAMSSPEYRSHLVQALFYKFVIAACGDRTGAHLRSAGHQLQREVSRGVQNFETDPELYPVNQPVEKLEGPAQCSGEAAFTADAPPVPGELCAAFVVSTVANCELESVDASPALAMPGVVAFVDHRDIPGTNNANTGRFVEEIFCSGKVHYAGQSLGLVVAQTSELAHRAARAVLVKYKNQRTPILTIKQAIRAAETEKDRVTSDPQLVDSAVEIIGEDSDAAPVVTVQGEFEIGSQYHFHLESQTCLVRPIENGQLEVFSATQWIKEVHTVVARALNIAQNCIDMKVRRLGGAYGAKISRPNLVAAAAAVAAVKLDRPIRLIMDLKSNMEMKGKRLPYLAQYKATVTSAGRLRSVDLKLYSDSGYTFNEVSVGAAKAFAQNVYSATSWRIAPNGVVTNTPANTWCRAPGTTQGHAIIENVMEHIAAVLGMDPLELRMLNLMKRGDNLIDGTKVSSDVPIRDLIESVKTSSNYSMRKKQIEEHNKMNRWTKRGLSLVPVRYIHNYFGTRYHVLVTVYSDDGSVAVTHGGIEMGQGINTKVAQTVAKELGVPLASVKIKPADNLTSPNNSVTGGSMGSECVPAAAQIACRDLKARMGKIKAQMSNPNPTWLELVKECHDKAVDLSARYMGHSGTDNLQGYDVWAAVVTEVEVDVLTGELNVRRADLIEDTGTAISPAVDVGQVEGGFIMALGLWTSEEIKLDPATGRLLTNDTWTYKVPSSKDIPEDLRTTFYNSRNNPYGVMGSKATGEPSVLMGVGVLFAIRSAINAAKKDLGSDLTSWYQLNGPATVEKIQMTSGVTAENFVI